MMKNRSKVFVTLIALVAVVAAAALAFAATGNAVSFASSSASASSSTDFSTPGVDPWGTAFDSHGNVWVALPGCDPSPTCASGTPPGKIGEFNPTSNTWTKVYALPSGFGQPLFLAFDKSGNLWFPMPMSNSLGELVVSSGAFFQWKLPTASSGPWAIAIAGNGTIWITEHYTNKIAAFNPSTKKFVKQVSTPAGNSQPYGITVDHSGNVWFTENNSAVAKIAEYTTGGQLKEYKIRSGSTSNLTPHLITMDGSGNIWWSEGWSQAIGKLVVSKAKPGTNSGVTEYKYSGPSSNGSHTSGIAVDHSGNIWFTDSLESVFGSFNGSAFTLYNTPTANSHPHDGLNVSASNVVWFDEEFANKLARH